MCSSRDRTGPSGWIERPFSSVVAVSCTAALLGEGKTQPWLPLARTPNDDVSGRTRARHLRRRVSTSAGSPQTGTTTDRHRSRGVPAVRQRRHAEECGVARQDRLHRRVQGARKGRRRVGKLNIEGDGQGDLAGTAESSAPSSSTRSTPIGTGSASSDETTSSTGSSARTSPSKV
jgi:hypothetical protein